MCEAGTDHGGEGKRPESRKAEVKAKRRGGQAGPQVVPPASLDADVAGGAREVWAPPRTTHTWTAGQEAGRNH